MSDLAYNIVVGACYPAFWVSSSPIWLGRENVPKTGRVIIASTHLSHYDVPCLMAASPRNVDFMSVVEFRDKPFVGRLFKSVNCIFLDRSRSDLKTVRAALDRLEAGRAVMMFPEGRIRDWEESAIRGKPFKPGVARLAYLSDAPVVPCVVLGSDAYKKFSAWLPLKRTRYGIIYGQPLTARRDLPERESVQDLVERLSQAYGRLYRELSAAMGGHDRAADAPA